MCDDENKKLVNQGSDDLRELHVMFEKAPNDEEKKPDNEE
jgi:hypothetical protein